MSGIAGIIRFDGGPVERNVIETMTAAMTYRGPDGIHHWVRGSVALGQCMLRTTAESLEETQPLTNEDESLVLVMDGRVDNWEELRRELLTRGAVLRTRADAELVLRAYEIWGPECLSHIDGDFALVIWDARRQEAFCARDHMGNKPFTYHWDGKILIFASEVRAILGVPGIRRTLNEGMVAEFLACDWLSRDETVWQTIYRLPAAHRAIVSSGGLLVEEYWTPDLDAPLRFSDESEIVGHYRDLLEETVRRMSRSHAPLACEVSGGLDSSALFAVADELLKRGQLPAPNLDGYTLAFDDDSEANELVYARAVARHVGRPVQEVPPTQLSIEWFRQWAIVHREFPAYPNSTMGLGIRAKACERGSRVLLVGVGGDQWLCGSRSYYAEALAAGRWDELLGCMDDDRHEVGLPKTVWWVLRHGCYPLLPEYVRTTIRWMLRVDRLGGIDTRAWLSPRMKAALRMQNYKHRRMATPRYQRVGQRENWLTLLSAHSANAREQEESMASSAGIEVRRPFFCRDMVQFAFSTPARWRLRGNTDKFLHRRAIDGLVPDVVRDRQSKADFTIMFSRYRSLLQRVLTGDPTCIPTDWVVAGSAEWLFRATDLESPVHSAVKLRMMWSLFACAAVDGRLTAFPKRA